VFPGFPNLLDHLAKGIHIIGIKAFVKAKALDCGAGWSSRILYPDIKERKEKS